jgi:hypothetical protein
MQLHRAADARSTPSLTATASDPETFHQQKYLPILQSKALYSSSVNIPVQNLLSKAGAMAPMLPPTQIGGVGPQSATLIFQHIQEMSSKRISTLNYLRKASVCNLHQVNCH